MTSSPIGMPIEVAVWLTGMEPEEFLARWKADCQAEVTRWGRESGVIMSTPVYTEKRPGEDRVPDVPDHISGPDVRLLVCESTVVSAVTLPVIVPASGFTADLDKRDLTRLRAITREAHANAWPTAPILTDAECDEVIERIGPDSAMKTLIEGVDSKAIH